MFPPLSSSTALPLAGNEVPSGSTVGGVWSPFSAYDTVAQELESRHRPRRWLPIKSKGRSPINDLQQPLINKKKEALDDIGLDCH